MQHIEEIRQKYFMECKKIISDLLYTENAEDLADNKYQIDKLLEKVSFLKVLNETPEIFSLEDKTDPIFVEEHPQALDLSAEEEAFFENDEKPTFSDDESTNEFASDIQQLSPAELEAEEDSVKEELPSTEERLVEDNFAEEIQEVVSKVSEKPEESVELNETAENEVEEELAIEELIEEASISEEAYQKSAELAETEAEERSEASELNKTNAEAKENYFEESVEHPHQKPEKKFKLPHIKGLKTFESLFDDDPLEQGIKEDSGSILKSNVSTDFMEAEKPKQEFKLDLNDRIAFSKMLFGGSQTDMNDAVNKLNSFKTLDEAKEYLSDIYYQKNWKKVDEYAQRLWHLVENKFQ